uniref:Putative secreted protein n=1 Tax=Panstrongylus lignarius TaxID=156445 RepID=A0A224XYD8_9HEMI
MQAFLAAITLGSFIYVDLLNGLYIFIVNLAPSFLTSCHPLFSNTASSILWTSFLNSCSRNSSRLVLI